MSKRQKFAWYVGGFVLTIAVALAISLLAAPQIGLAQEGSPNLLEFLGRFKSEAVAPDAVAPEALGDPDALVPMPKDIGADALVEGAKSGGPNAERLTPLAVESSNYLVIPAAAFMSDGYWPNSSFMYFYGGYIRGANSAHYGCVEAPVYLPYGATIDALYAYLYDNDASWSTGVELHRVRTMTGIHDYLGAVYTSGYHNYIQYIGDTTISPSFVDSIYYEYYVTTCLDSNYHRLYGVRIHWH